MRILYVVNSLAVAGAEQMTLSLATQIARNTDNEVALLLLWDEKNELEVHEPKIELLRLSAKRKYAWSILQLLPSILAQFDIVHVHLFPSLYYVSLASRQAHPTPRLAFTEHSVFNRRMNRSWRSLDRWMYSRYHRIIAISDEVENKILTHLGPDYRDRLVKIQNGIDLHRYQSAEPYDPGYFFPEGSRILIQVARFAPPKDQKTTIEALSFLPDQYHLLLVGIGEEMASAKSIAQKLNLQKRVQFLGLRSDIDRLLATADVGILSSGYEGFSLSALEMMASKLPIVASNVHGLREMILGCGLLFDYKNPQDLSQKILDIDRHSEKTKTLTQKASAKAKENSIGSMMDQYLHLYSNVLDSNRKNEPS